jgi:hypothetical protein
MQNLLEEKKEKYKHNVIEFIPSFHQSPIEELGKARVGFSFLFLFFSNPNFSFLKLQQQKA